MTPDPRVKAVAEALHASEHAGEMTRSCPAWDDAAIAVAALDAYDGPRFSSVVHECCERPTEADLRERIAQEIEAMLPTIPCPDFDRSCACSLCYETHAIRSAAAVARGQA